MSRSRSQVCPSSLLVTSNLPFLLGSVAMVVVNLWLGLVTDLISVLATTLMLTFNGAGEFKLYGICEMSFAASVVSVGGTYLGAIVVGTVRRTALSSTGSSVMYSRVILAPAPGLSCPSLMRKMSGEVSSRRTAVWRSFGK